MQCKLLFLFVLLLSISNPAKAQIELDSIPTEDYDFIKRPTLAMGEVFLLNLIVNRYDAWILGGGMDFAKVTPDSWKANLEHGLEWDWNSFSTNWFAHPYHGALYFNSARSSGMTFWESAPYSLAGSLMWEYFGETHPPSGNDLVNTTLGGMYLGEMFHRLSDKLHTHDSKTKGGKVWRATLGTLLNPMRTFNRWVSGRPLNSTDPFNPERYEKPLRMHFAAGGNFFFSSLNVSEERRGPFVEFAMLYGDPFAKKDFFKPMEVFNLRSWIRFVNDEGDRLPFLNVYAYGNLWGKNIHYTDEASHMFGIFQHYDYLHNEAIEIGSIGFSGAVLSNYKLSEKFNLMTAFHLGGAALGGANSEIVGEFTNDPESLREYVLGPGIMGKADVVLEGEKMGELVARMVHYTVFISSGPSGTERVNLLDFRYSYPIVGRFNLGVNYTLYLRRVHYDDYPEYQDFKRNLYEFKTFIAIDL